MAEKYFCREWMMQDNSANESTIFGSSRSHGNTRKIIEEITRGGFFPFIDLSDFVIKPFDYEYRNKEDDFILLMEKIVQLVRVTGDNRIAVEENVFLCHNIRVLSFFLSLCKRPFLPL